jgi:hypothetical protein
MSSHAKLLSAPDPLAEPRMCGKFVPTGRSDLLTCGFSMRKDYVGVPCSPQGLASR